MFIRIFNFLFILIVGIYFRSGSNNIITVTYSNCSIIQINSFWYGMYAKYKSKHHLLVLSSLNLQCAFQKAVVMTVKLHSNLTRLTDHIFPCALDGLGYFIVALPEPSI